MSAPHVEPSQLPRYLQSLPDFRAYLEDEFSDQNSPQRGSRFVNAMLQLLPYLPQADGFSGFTLSPTVSHDRGVDISSEPRADGSVMRVQSRYKLDRVDDLDSVISKFEDYETTAAASAIEELPLNLDGPSASLPVYLVLTTSDIDSIAALYETKARSSLQFYNRVLSEGRLSLVGGQGILDVLRRQFVKTSSLPTSLELTSPHGWLQAGDVYLGVVRGPDIVKLFDEYGEGLFFENIREWLGMDESRVNASISRTIREEPARMLERNNGLTIRGESVRPLEAGRLRADRAAIINGCQTTMSLWHARPTDPELLVQVKVVQTPPNEDAWTIARSANYQNDVSQIDLELARYLRPQIVNKAAASQGIGLAQSRDDSLPGLLAQLTETEVTFALTKYVFLGLFCSPPNQLFNDNYSKVRMDVLHSLYADDIGAEERLFSSIFRAVEAGRRASAEARDAFDGEPYSALYQRLLDPKKQKYAAYLILLAACGALRFDLSERVPDPAGEAKRISQFLEDLEGLLVTEGDVFVDAYLIAFKVYAGSTDRREEGDDKTLQRLSGRLQDASFAALYRQVCMEIDTVSRLVQRKTR